MVKRFPNVVLVGRPNVGKSTLFNRLSDSRRAIVTGIPGTTRDVIEQTIEWQGTHFRLIDTGGMFGASDDPLYQLVFERGRLAMGEADLLLLVVDGREGFVPADQEVAETVRRAAAPAVLVINKTDDRRAKAGALEFYRLGFDPVSEVSAEHGLGIGDLLDAVVGELPGVSQLSSHVGVENDEEDTVASAPEIAVAVVGRPNAGKSSLVNRLLRDERMLVSDMPGTTRDAVDSVLTWHRRRFRIIDTAGIRRPGRVAGGGQVESVSVLLARRAIEAGDVVVLVIDATAGITEQDASIAGEADRGGSGIIIVANKWDLMKGSEGPSATEFDEDVRQRLKFLSHAPVLHVSASTGERTAKLLETIDRVAMARMQRVKTTELNKFIEVVTVAHPPPTAGQRRVRILYAAQIGVAPPTFVFFTNIATEFHFSYERFLVNQIRGTFGFEGSPIRLLVRRKQGRRGRQAKPSR
jgi:GTP-binding protein